VLYSAVCTILYSLLPVPVPSPAATLQPGVFLHKATSFGLSNALSSISPPLPLSPSPRTLLLLPPSALAAGPVPAQGAEPHLHQLHLCGTTRRPSTWGVENTRVAGHRIVGLSSNYGNPRYCQNPKWILLWAHHRVHVSSHLEILGCRLAGAG